MAYAKEVAERMEEKGLRIEVDDRDEKLGYKIREARMDKVPYMIILGEKEQNNQSVSVRQRDAQEGNQDMGEMSLDELMKLIGEAK